MSRFFAILLVAAGPILCCMADSNCIDEDLEYELCGVEGAEENGALGVKRLSPFSGHFLVLMMALASCGDGVASLMFFHFLPLVAFFPNAKADSVTCGNVKAMYKDGGCCKQADDKLIDESEWHQRCPYNFTLPKCADAEPQAPRDLRTNNGVFVNGDKIPKTPALSCSQTVELDLVNVHFHDGAEHMSDSYNKVGNKATQGYQCNAVDDLSDADKNTDDYEWKHCEHVSVGQTYEIHYVHSSAQYSNVDTDSGHSLEDGLGGAANGKGLLNPTISVQALVILVVSNSADSDKEPLPLYGFGKVGLREIAYYMGSTTGTSVNNNDCSPYAVSWHVDLKCHKVKAKAFDDMCQMMLERYNISKDLHPHGSREIVSPAFVVKDQYVYMCPKEAGSTTSSPSSTVAR